MRKYFKKGISLIVLVITIIVIIVLTSAVILTLTNSGILDKSKKARFMSDFREVESGVNLFSLSKYNATTQKFELPLKGYLTAQDKTDISQNVPTLKTKIDELSGSIDSANLAWINSEDIGAKLSTVKQDKGYIIDVNNGQIYDYIGDVFENKRWHTLDDGVAIGETAPKITTEELWDGWIKLTLYYPAGSTEKKWRLGTEGELRVDPMLMWQDYTGPITIPLDRVKDVWIKYILDNKEVTIPPAGTLLVDIVPDKTGSTKVSQVNVKINYDESATVKEYRVGDSGWITYTGEFSVTENCIIEARAKKTETIYNTDGSVLTTRNVAGKDLVYVGNIGVEETALAAPTITRLAPIGTEKARVQITYPLDADRKIYKVNYGVEENYTSEINVNSYGTYIIAYYYDSTGKRSLSSSIYINDTTGGIPAEASKSYDPTPSNPTAPNDVPAPTVSVNPTTLIDSVQVSINSPANADKVYIKLGRYGDYQEYTSPITVRQNMEVYAYYRTYTGEKSNVGYGVVSNIKQNNKPYVYIDANPYPWSSSYGADSVTVTINYSDANTIEYSEDGIVYKPYTAPLTVTKNEIVYARGTNAYGVTETSLNITNIGNLKAPTPITNLAVNINVNPEPALSTTRVAKATVTIDYDTKATEKYYSIGKYGTLKTYTGAFDVTSSCTIYAYAKGTNAKGEASKTIDNISSGISEPVITAVPGNSTQASKVSVTIAYDKYATIKRYSIDGATLRDYTGAFEITKNGTVIYAYSENALGQKSEASYKVQNIVPEPPTLLLDKGSYYLLKLNYPETSKNREYKWKAEGTWTGYKEAGILLIKPQFKDNLIQNGTLVKIEDENGNMVTFTGDYYLIDVPISELSENLFMRWDREPLAAPQILINPVDPAMTVTTTITYPTAAIKKQYKIIKPGEVSGEWLDYTGPITIDKNNTVIYAKGMDETEVWSAEGMKKVTNIDETSPVIKLTADLTTAGQKIPVKVNVTDDVAVGKVKWAEGTQGESYFANAGTEIPNDSIVNITSNGYYTFYAEDQVGNKQVYTLNVTNVDLTPPVIDIAISPENTIGLTANVAINYGDSTTKQYKVGTSNNTWSNYTTTFAISSYTILSNNWQNADGTVTIYAKGKDASGNEITVQKKVLSLDLDKPKLPIINSNSSYATLYEYGAKIDATTNITYDSRTDIDNYYSIDNGTTWLTYTGNFDMSSGTVIAKSVKKTTGLESVVSVTITMPADAMKIEAYDNNDLTSTFNGWLRLDSSMINKKIRMKLYYCYADLYAADKTTLVQRFTYDNNVDTSITIPQNSEWIKISSTRAGGGKIFEIQTSNEPTFTAESKYLLLHTDTAKTVHDLYQMVTINYFTTSVQRLYRIGTTGMWIDYTDQPVKVNQGETIYAKGIDKNGNETRIISSYTSNVPDGLKKEAYDNDDLTSATNGWIQVDSSMINRKVTMKLYYCNVDLYAADRTTLLQNVKFATNGQTTITILQNCSWIKISPTNTGGGIVYEMRLLNEPTFTATNNYMVLNADLAKAVKQPSQMVTVNYFPTSVQRLYNVGNTGIWLSYNDQPIKVNNGETIYAKGIDQYGNETRIVSSYTANVLDAIKAESFDGNDTTSMSASTGVNYDMEVDSSMQGRNIRVRWQTVYTTSYMRFLDANKQEISNVNRSGAATRDEILTIPANTKWIRYQGTISGGGYTNYLYEIVPCNEPSFSATNGYMLMPADPLKAIKSPYQMVTVNYFPTSVQKLYRVGTTGEWLNYQNQPIKVDQGQIIYAKGIDQYGIETRIVSSYTADVPDALKSAAFDENDSTYIGVATNQYMEVDSSMQGKNIRVKFKNDCVNTSLTATVKIEFLDTNKQQISMLSWGYGTFDLIVKVPENTKWIVYTGTPYGSYNPYLYEIQPSNEPTYTATNGYMLLTYDPANSIKTPYQMVTVNYFTTSVQRLYRIGLTGNWLSYADVPIKVNQGETIYGKGIDQYGIETRIISSYTTDVPDALKSEAYDGNDATYIGVASNKYMEVDSSMQGRNIRLKFRNDCLNTASTAKTKIDFLDVNKQQISTQTWGYGTFDLTVPVPANAKWIVYTGTSYSYYNPYLFEIQPAG